MKISELIQLLAQELQKHGDLEVNKGCECGRGGEEGVPIMRAVHVPKKLPPIRL